LKPGENIKVYKTDDRAKAQVAVELVQANALELHLKPTGPCPAPNEATLECFEGNVSYTVELTTTIKSGGGRSLYCPLAGDAFNCKRVFITGDQFDNDAPTVAIVNYQSGESVPLGGTAEIRVRARDGFGVDTLQYSLNDQMVYASDAGGGTDVTDTFVWDIDKNVYRAREPVQVSVQARDVDGHVTVSEPVRLIPRPAHCFNRKQDADEKGPDCGGEFCGACAGAACRGNADCAAGVCRVPAGAEVGVCVELPVITDVNPPDGAAGTVVTIEGRYFGAQAGQVVFYKSANEPIAAGNLCGAQWSPDAITVSVPAGLEANKVAVIGVRTAGGDEDRTNDDRGAKFENVFTVNDVARPGLCSLDPKSGLINDRVTVRGVNLGNGGASGLLFADQPARVDRWDQDRDGQLGEIVGFVPNIGAGAVRVAAQVGDKKSNTLPFEIRAFREQDRPNIGSVSPDRGPMGTYVTIAGTGFGAAGQGSVAVFEHRASGVTFFAATDFPPECGAGTWNDRMIVVKVPRGVDLGAAAGGVAPYKIQVKRG
ncbi:MAG: IPT/TIG domain-containing protein, partial [Patescibacteria group bacterium]